MSARPSARDQLFTSRTADQTNIQAGGPPPPSDLIDRGATYEQYGLQGEAQDPLQLEHMLGYAGEYRKTVLSLPSDDQLYVKR